MSQSMSGGTVRRRRYLFFVAVGFLIFATSNVRAADDHTLEQGTPMSSRIPLLDESSLDKFGNSPMLNSQQETVDEEYPPGTLIPLETKNLRYFSFFTKVKHQIEQSKYYPKEAVKDLLSGAVTVSLEINRNGSLGDVKVTSSSGKDILDEAALDIVQRATPFPNVPSRINHTPLKVATSIMFIPTPEVIQRQEGLGLSIPMK